jgi:hypothetical protein
VIEDPPLSLSLTGGVTPTNEFANKQDIDKQYVVQETDLDDHTAPSKYGISLPAPLLTGKYNSQSRYSLIPWSDGLVCACPYKQKRPSRMMCKHELAATIRLADEDEYVLPIDDILPGMNAGVSRPQLGY